MATTPEPTKECYHCGSVLFRHDDFAMWHAHDPQPGEDAAYCSATVPRAPHEPIDIRPLALASWRETHNKETATMRTHSATMRTHSLSVTDQDRINKILEDAIVKHGLCADGVKEVYDKVNEAVGFQLLQRPRKTKRISVSFSFDVVEDYSITTLETAVRRAIEHQAGTYSDTVKNFVLAKDERRHES